MKSFLVITFLMIFMKSYSQKVNITMERRIGYNPYDIKSTIPDTIEDSTSYKFYKNNLKKHLVKRFKLSLSKSEASKLLYDYIDILIATTKKGNYILRFDVNRDKNFEDETKTTYVKLNKKDSSNPYFNLIFPYRVKNTEIGVSKIVKPNLVRGGMNLGSAIENELFLALDEYSYMYGTIVNGKNRFAVVTDDIVLSPPLNELQLLFNNKNDKSNSNIQTSSVGDTVRLSTGFVRLESIEKERDKLVIILNNLSNVHPTGSNVGFVAPKFLLPNLQGRKVSNSDFKNKYVLIDFWASWCKPCRIEHPYLRKVYKKYQNKNFTIVSISIDDDKKHWISAIQKDKIEKWPQLISEKGWNSEILQPFKVSSVPANFLINPKGVIIEKGLKREKLSNMLDKIYGDLNYHQN